MDALELIPQLFFDLISRVVPGTVAIVTIAIATDTKLGKLVSDYWDGSTTAQEPSIFIGFVFILAAYVSGQIISPISDFVENQIAKRLFPSYYQVLKTVISNEDERPSAMRKFLKDELGLHAGADVNKVPLKQYHNAVFVWYDWLRVNASDAGARAAKIRAEYRMHSQNAVVVFIALVLHLIFCYTHLINPNAVFVTTLIVVGLASLWATARTHRTFQWAVLNQFYSAKATGININKKAT